MSVKGEFFILLEKIYCIEIIIDSIDVFDIKNSIFKNVCKGSGTLDLM